MTTVLFWDIDGTLLTTGGAGIFAWEEAFKKVTGRPIDLTKMQTAGLTDVQIAVKILRENDFNPTPNHITRMVRLYEEYLPASLPRKKGNVLVNVREILDQIKTQTDMVSMLLTGNTESGAQSKLTYYGLKHYFPQGAFADDSENRLSIARKALSMAKEKIKGFSLGKVYVIGDTPHDIHCGRAIGAKTIAVASGPYSTEQLLTHEPWWAIEELPPKEIFFKKIGLV